MGWVYLTDNFFEHFAYSTHTMFKKYGKSYGKKHCLVRCTLHDGCTLCIHRSVPILCVLSILYSVYYYCILYCVLYIVCCILYVVYCIMYIVLCVV